MSSPQQTPVLEASKQLLLQQRNTHDSNHQQSQFSPHTSQQQVVVNNNDIQAPPMPQPPYFDVTTTTTTSRSIQQQNAFVAAPINSNSFSTGHQPNTLIGVASHDLQNSKRTSAKRPLKDMNDESATNRSQLLLLPSLPAWGANHTNLPVKSEPAIMAATAVSSGNNNRLLLDNRPRQAPVSSAHALPTSVVGSSCNSQQQQRLPPGGATIRGASTIQPNSTTTTTTTHSTGATTTTAALPVAAASTADTTSKGTKRRRINSVVTGGGCTQQPTATPTESRKASKATAGPRTSLPRSALPTLSASHPIEHTRQDESAAIIDPLKCFGFFTVDDRTRNRSGVKSVVTQLLARASSRLRDLESICSKVVVDESDDEEESLILGSCSDELRVKSSNNVGEKSDCSTPPPGNILAVVVKEEGSAAATEQKNRSCDNNSGNLPTEKQKEPATEKQESNNNTETPTTPPSSKFPLIPHSKAARLQLARLAEISEREIRLTALQQHCFRLLRNLNVCFPSWGKRGGSFLWHSAFILGATSLRDLAPYCIVFEEIWDEVKLRYIEALGNAKGIILMGNKQQQQRDCSPSTAAAAALSTPRELTGALLTSLMFQGDSVSYANCLTQLDQFRRRIDGDDGTSGAPATTPSDFQELLTVFTATQALHSQHQPPTKFILAPTTRFRSAADLTAAIGGRGVGGRRKGGALLSNGVTATAAGSSNVSLLGEGGCGGVGKGGGRKKNVNVAESVTKRGGRRTVSVRLQRMGWKWRLCLLVNVPFC